MLNLNQIVLIDLDESITTNLYYLKFKSKEDIQNFIEQTGIKNYTITGLKLTSDNITIVNHREIIITPYKTCLSALLKRFTEIGIALARKSM